MACLMAMLSTHISLLLIILCQAASKENIIVDNRVIDLQDLMQNVSKTLAEHSRQFKQIFTYMDLNKCGGTNRKISTTDNNGDNAVHTEVVKKANGNQDFVPTDNKVDIDVHTEVVKKTDGNHARDCNDLYLAGRRESGPYTIMLCGKEVQVYCDMDTDGGGWTVIQRRGQYGNPQDYFYRTWKEYSDGFGNLTAEFWLGNDHISALTTSGEYGLRVDLRDMENTSAFARYAVFRVEDARHLYKLNVSRYSGNAGDSLAYFHHQMPFATKDRDQGSNIGNKIIKCSEWYKGAWWYGLQGCHKSNLNGLNWKGAHQEFASGINWSSWREFHYSMAFTEMKVRPADFEAKTEKNQSHCIR